jgi:hypothetical protein
MTSLNNETFRRYSIYERNQHVVDFRTNISGSNTKNGVDSYLGRVHEYNRELYTATDLSGINDNEFINKYKASLSGKGGLLSNTNDWNPDFPEGTIDFDYKHPNALGEEWNKDQLHLPMPNTVVDLKDNPYRGHPNLQVQPFDPTDPSAIFDVNNEWIAAKPEGILPQINPKTDGTFGVYDETRNEIKSSRESIGKYFSKIYTAASDSEADLLKRSSNDNLGKSTI